MENVKGRVCPRTPALGKAIDTPPGPGVSFNAVSGSGPGDVVAVGSKGTVVRYDGTTWSKEPTPPSSNALYAVSIAGPGES